MPRHKIPYDTVASLAEQGMGVTQIAKELGCSKSGVCVALQKMGISMARDVATRTARQIADQKFDLIAKIQDVLTHQLNRLHYLQRKWNNASNQKEKDDFERRLDRTERRFATYVSQIFDIHKFLYSPEEVARAFQLLVRGIRECVDKEQAERIIEHIDSGRVIKRVS